MGVLTDKEIRGYGLVKDGLGMKISHDTNGYKLMSYGLEPHGYTMTLSNPDNLLDYNLRTDAKTGRKYFYLDSFCQMTLKCNEFLQIRDNVVGFLYPKSSYSRVGLLFSLAVVDAGFNGHISFSVFNSSDTYHKLYVDEGIIQIVFHESELNPSKSYDGQYQEKYEA